MMHDPLLFPMLTLGQMKNFIDHTTTNLVTYSVPHQHYEPQKLSKDSIVLLEYEQPNLEACWTDSINYHLVPAKSKTVKVLISKNDDKLTLVLVYLKL